MIIRKGYIQSGRESAFFLKEVANAIDSAFIPSAVSREPVTSGRILWCFSCRPVRRCTRRSHGCCGPPSTCCHPVLTPAAVSGAVFVHAGHNVLHRRVLTGRTSITGQPPAGRSASGSVLSDRAGWRRIRLRLRCGRRHSPPRPGHLLQMGQILPFHTLLPPTQRSIR